MVDRQRARQIAKGLPGWACLATSLAALSSTDAAALSPGSPAGAHGTAGVILIQDAGKAPGAEPATAERAPFAELNEALAAARARLEELSQAATAAAAGSQARQELESVRDDNQRLRAELIALRAHRDELRDVAEGNQARLAELSKNAEAAVAEAKRIEEELVTMRWQNAQLNTGLARAQTARERLEEDARKAQAELTTKVESLSASAQRSAAEIARLRGELAAAEQRVAAAAAAREEADARLAEVQDALAAAQARSGQLDQQVATLRDRLDAIAGERDQARQQVAAVQSETEALRGELASLGAEARRVAAERSELAEEVGMLRAAAGSAADAARQNLLAVEERIRELNAALGGIEPGAPATGSEAVARPAPVASAGPERRAEAAPAAVPAQRVAAAAPQEPAQPEAAGGELELIKSANAAEAPPHKALNGLTPDLSPEMRLQVQGLLVDLGAKADAQGVRMTVPGSTLFELDSDTIEPTAHETLAKVAELIDAYKDHQVMIVGHTDSLGDEAYNKTLSERRANLVKQFFVDNFEVDAARLAIDGQGEVQPIASNDTLAGRRANRRIDVLILD
jgi:chemotaxis protein MotB